MATAATHTVLDRPATPSGDAVAGPGTRVLVVTGSVGAGHDGAAHELAARLTAAGARVEVRDFLDALRPRLACSLRSGYTGGVGRAPVLVELLYRRLEHRGLLWAIERRICRSAETAMRGWVDAIDPDVVVTTYPLAAQTLGDLRAAGDIRVPVLTYLTDPAVHVSWLHPAVDAHLTVTAATAAQGRRDYGLPFTVAGPLVPARFGQTMDLAELVALRGEVGVRTDRPVALLVAGSLGLGDVAGAAVDVAAAGFSPVVLCGRNAALRDRLDRLPDVLALGWRTDMHRLMQLVDVLVHNAGGLTCTEALVAGLPTVTYKPIPGHGRANATVLHESGMGPWATDPVDLRAALLAQLGRDRTPPAMPDPTDTVLSWVPAARRPARPAVLAAALAVAA
ncbi:UDP-N-acetylglucosamine:LPS N-acetylglucosamine transferase [Klenkia soli]|uniref:UDP-N-acetylglucosamine:LPS N-acetylglucosamine transferase n=1 Tax=Klenkia soli TaxID=1052260 RepID=A0A1H0IR93_9ACTN|nr:hypothetical protein [Klenkia soli]SDO33946.1 UDP-N-acetylglucosamine:LPS N-acetylglucosamine transferase [Klenkia soli]